jgi:hypothetical protein
LKSLRTLVWCPVEGLLLAVTLTYNAGSSAVSLEEYIANQSEFECLKVFCPEGKRSVGKPRKLWLEDVENLKKAGFKRLEKNRYTDAWKLILKKVRVLLGP